MGQIGPGLHSNWAEFFFPGMDFYWVVTGKSDVSDVQPADF